MNDNTESYRYWTQLYNREEMRISLVQEAELNLIAWHETMTTFSAIKPRLFMDGNQWCCLGGDDLQIGICGFGDTPRDAIKAWYLAMSLPADATPRFVAVPPATGEEGGGA